jgi:hypothetical protein
VFKGSFILNFSNQFKLLLKFWQEIRRQEPTEQYKNTWHSTSPASRVAEDIQERRDQAGGGLPCCHDPQARFTQAGDVSR